MSTVPPSRNADRKQCRDEPDQSIDRDAIKKQNHTRQHLHLQLAYEKGKLFYVALDKLGVAVFLWGPSMRTTDEDEANRGETQECNRSHLAHDTKMLIDNLASHEFAMKKMTHDIFALGGDGQKFVLRNLSVVAVTSLQIFLGGLECALQFGNATRLDGSQLGIIVEPVLVFVENIKLSVAHEAA